MKLKSFIVFIILFAVVPAFALSPDDSVIFYGRLSGNVECHFFQCDSSYPVDYQIFEGEYFISSPVLLNSSYRLSFVRGRVKEPFDLLSRLSNSESIWENRYSLQDRSFDIKIPAEPGLFFLGSYDGKESFLNGMYVLSPENQVEEELKILKKVQKAFQKTEWENLINARIEELKNEIEK